MLSFLHGSAQIHWQAASNDRRLYARHPVGYRACRWGEPAAKPERVMPVASRPATEAK